MATITFRVDESLQNRFEGVASELGLNKSSILRDAMSEKIEELEKLCIIKDRLDSYEKKKLISGSWSEEEKEKYLREALEAGLNSGVSSRTIDDIWHSVLERQI